MTQIIAHVPEKLLWGTVFLLPLLWVPFTADPLEFNKQTLLLIAIPLFALLWFVKSIKEGEISFSLSAPVLAAALFAILVAVAAIFSKDQWRGLLGSGSGSHESVAAVLAMVVFAFAAIHFFSKERMVEKILLSLVVAAGLSAATALLSVFGIFETLGISPGFNTIGTLSSFTVFLAVAFLAALPLLYRAKGIGRFLLLFVASIITATLFVMGAPVGWWMIAGGAAVYFLVLLRISPDAFAAMRWWFSPPLIAGLALAFAILQPNAFVRFANLPLEVSPNNATTFHIAKEALKERPLFGSGPGTWVYDYAKFRKAQPINDTPFWNLRFTQGSSKILSMPATHGSLGWLSWLGVLGAMAVGIFKMLQARVPQEGAAIAVASNATTVASDATTVASNATTVASDATAGGLVAAWIALAGASFATPSNITLDFLFWFFTAALIPKIAPQLLRYPLPRASARTAIVGMLVSFVGVVVVVSLFVGGTRYVAAVEFQQGLRSAFQNNLERASGHISRAASLDAHNDLYVRSLSDVGLLRLAQRIQSQDQPFSDRELEELVGATLNPALRATMIAPQNVANWTQLAIVRTNFISLGAPSAVAQILAPAVEAWQKAMELEPANPFLPTQRAIVYLNAADIMQGLGDEGEGARLQYLSSAGEALEQALALKPDYAPARFQRAMLAVREGKTQDAITELEAAQRLQPQDIGIAAQLGVLYFNEGRTREAETILQAVLQAAEEAGTDHANARYFLGLIDDREGRREEARAHFERILELNPGNVLIERILNNLREQRAALEGIGASPDFVPAPAVSDERPQTVPPEPQL